MKPPYPPNLRKALIRSCFTCRYGTGHIEYMKCNKYDTEHGDLTFDQICDDWEEMKFVVTVTKVTEKIR